MLSRRSFLVGAGAVTVTGAVGVAAVGPEKVLHKVGLRRSPDHHVPESGYAVEEHTLASAAMGRDVTWAMCVPPQGADGVVVCLHGRNNDRRYAFDSAHLHDVAASQSLPLAVASIDGGSHSYWHPREDGTDALSMVLDELLPEIDEALGEVGHAVLGWSMGAYGALLVAEQRPQSFHAVVATSPALWRTFEESSGGAFDSAEDFEAHNVFTAIDNLRSLRVRVDCGTDDGFVHAAKQFAEQLPVTNEGSFSRGYHDARYSRSVAPAQIATIGEALSLT